MGLIIDFLLLAASGAACFYCWVLSARLRALTNTKSGLQMGIAALSQSAEDIQSAMAETKRSASANSENLEILVKEADQRILEMRALSKQIIEISNNAVDDTEAAMKGLVAALEPKIEEARNTANALQQAVDGAPTQAAPKATAQESEKDGSDDDSSNDFEIEVDLDARDDSDIVKQGEAA